MHWSGVDFRDFKSEFGNTWIVGSLHDVPLSLKPGVSKLRPAKPLYQWWKIIYLLNICWIGRIQHAPKQPRCLGCPALELLCNRLCGPLTKTFGDPWFKPAVPKLFPIAYHLWFSYYHHVPPCSRKTQSNKYHSIKSLENQNWHKCDMKKMAVRNYNGHFRN